MGPASGPTDAGRSVREGTVSLIAPTKGKRVVRMESGRDFCSKRGRGWKTTAGKSVL